MSTASWAHVGLVAVISRYLPRHAVNGKPRPPAHALRALPSCPSPNLSASLIGVLVKGDARSLAAGALQQTPQLRLIRSPLAW